MADGSLSLQNGYVHVTLHKLLETYSYLTVVPAAKPDEDSMWNSQTPYCNYTTYKQGVPTTKGVCDPASSPEKDGICDGYAQRRRHEGNQGGV